MSPPVHAQHGSTGSDSPASAGRVWRDEDLDGLHDREDKASRVRSMFAAIARSYDLNNRVHSLWRDQAWRRFAVRAAEIRASDRVLDVACGTGDLTQAFARSGAAQVVGLDFTVEMLEIAGVKRDHLPREQADRIAYMQGDAMALPFGDAEFDVVSIAFGIRNVQRPADAISEFARVLRPGGRLIVLEFDTPRLAPVRLFNRFYAGWLMPRTATLVARDRSGAYRYLPRSVGSFMSRDEVAAQLEASGLERVTAKPLSLGICVCYRGFRADEGPS